MHERIKAYTNREQGTLPADAELIAFGTDLFETLFQGDVRRLYDEARSRQHGRKLDFVFTSMVSWIAEKPWEFAYDASRRSFLATEDIHFVRNVLTAIPADVIPPRAGPLRILVASAQPAGFGRLSVEQELEVIRRGFDPLIDAGLAASRSAATRHAAQHPRTTVDRQLHDRALHRPRSFRRQDAGGLAGVRGRAWRRIPARRTLGARNLLPARRHARVPERLPDRLWRPRRLQQGRGAVAGGARSAGAGRQPVQRAGLVGHPVRAALLLGAGTGHDDRRRRRAKRASPSTIRCRAK